jgi:hypothetical protein
MSFYSLSQELKNEIYKHALCPAEGVTIKPDGYSDDSKFKCIQAVASALLRTNSQVYNATLPILYGANVFSLEGSCSHALRFLQTLSKSSRLQIKRLSLSSRLMAADDYDNREYAQTLCKFIIADMRLDDVTLAVPNDMEAGTEGKDKGQYEWFMWTLHEGLLQAFKGGQFRQIRIVHPNIYDKGLSVYGFYNVENYIEDMLIEECQQRLYKRRSQYWDSYFDSRFGGTVCEDNVGAVHECVRKIWHGAGYTVERDSSGQGEGTALVIQRISIAKKRHYVDAGLVVNGKRAKTKGAEKKKGEPGKNMKKREGSFLHILKGIGNGSAKAERERLLIGGRFARDRAVMKCVTRAYKAWEYKSERRAGNFGDALVLDGLEYSLDFWRDMGCQLCALYRSYDGVYSHQLHECKRWDESKEAWRMLQLLRKVKIKAVGGENAAGQCYSCLFPRQLCYRFQYQKRMDEEWGCEQEANKEGIFYKVVGCENAEVTWRIVAALMAFENGALVESLCDQIAWVGLDDKAAMQRWMGEQYQHDGFSIPGVLCMLEMLEGVYEELMEIAEYNKFHKIEEEKKAEFYL